jgi:hypothetical protein
MALQILLIWAKGPPSNAENQAVRAAIADAQRIFGTLTLAIWGEVNREEEGPLPNLIGYTDAQDFVDANSASGRDVLRVRDLYLDANHRLATPVYVLFVVPQDELHNANGFSLLGGYCSVLPVPTGLPGTADGHTYAHEIAHGLGLPHVDSTANCMFPYRIVPPSALSGDELTTDQKVAMRSFLQAHLSLSEASSLNAVMANPVG